MDETHSQVRHLQVLEAPDILQINQLLKVVIQGHMMQVYDGWRLPDRRGRRLLWLLVWQWFEFSLPSFMALHCSALLALGSRPHICDKANLPGISGLAVAAVKLQSLWSC